MLRVSSSKPFKYDREELSSNTHLLRKARLVRHDHLQRGPVRGHRADLQSLSRTYRNALLVVALLNVSDLITNDVPDSRYSSTTE